MIDASDSKNNAKVGWSMQLKDDFAIASQRAYAILVAAQKRATGK